MILGTFRAAGAAILSVGLLVALAGCSPGMTAAVESMKLAWKGAGEGGADAVKLDPKFAYLRVTRGRFSTLLWRGVIERTSEGAVEVYYSGGGEVLRLRDGRLVGALGLPTEWRRVEDRAPAWSALVKSSDPVAFVRVRDVMPGYRSNVRDELTIRRIAAPESSALRVTDAQALTWLEERSGGERSGALPPARYALDLSGEQPTVVYSEQCVSADFCFTWQRWSTAVQQKAAVKPTR